MNLKEVFIRNSAWVWNNLRDARKLNIQLGEESVTDFLIFNLTKSAGKDLKIKSFSRNQEALNGADWEWWFTGPSGKWIGMRVQAKIITLLNDKYLSFKHKNKYGLQINLLEKDAKLKGMIPVYCMYTNWDPKKYKTPQNCGKHTSFVRHYGISLLSISNARKVKTNIIHLSNVMDYFIPLHCIFCSSSSKTMDLPDIVLEHAIDSGLIYNDEYINSDALLRDEPPYYVKQILNNENFEKLEADNRLKTITIFQLVE
ncbi:TPA: DUF6615 family protein [Acinetobacter baumannii]|nr:hypothetical protein [Acinetobacter baumannii]MDV7565339.1 DUF6615 family protein [Acinetobacter baumannii]